ncbi:MAG TPA: hypothetical protein VL357_03135 [Rariglobus sp.]|jgi:hypothetical protein|nr:hypothetical protein [Rariglobus sp.]
MFPDTPTQESGCLVRRLRDPHAKPGDLPVWWCSLWYGHGVLAIYSRALAAAEEPTINDIMRAHQAAPDTFEKQYPYVSSTNL